jgi:hypothetical protein
MKNLLFLCLFITNVKSEIYTVNCDSTELNHTNLYPCTAQIKTKQNGNSSEEIKNMTYFVRSDKKLSEKPIEISLKNGVLSVKDKKFEQNNISKAFDYISSKLDQNIFQINI